MPLPKLNARRRDERGQREGGRSGLARPSREESYKEKTNVICDDIGGR